MAAKTKSRKTAKRWVRTEADAKAVREGCYFDSSRGEHVCEFFDKYLRHTTGEWAGKPFTLLDWQRNEVLMPLFGWRRAGGLPRYNKASIWVAKKNGKSSLAAGLANYFLLCGGRRTEVYGAAYTREQASIVYREASAMAKASPALQTRLQSLETRKRIVCESTASFYQALAAEAGAVEGVIATLVIFDELHVQKTRVLWDALRYACDARPDSLLFSISTVGVADPTSIWWEEFQYAKGILDGAIEDSSTFAYIRQADETCKDDIEAAGDERQWEKANPSLDVTLRRDKFRDSYNEARQSVGKLNNFLRYKLNIPTSQFSRIIDMDHWAACCCQQLPELDGEISYGGLDLANSEDLAAFALYFPRPDGPDLVRCRFWLPEATIAKRRYKGHHFYDVWVREGWIQTTPGDQIDHHQIALDICTDLNRYQIVEIGYDAWNAGHVATMLEAEGAIMVRVPQTMSGLALGTKRLLEEIGKAGFRQPSPVLSWMAGNVAAVEDHAGNQRPAKDASADKIDGIVALIMALSRHAVAPECDDSGPVFL